MSDMFDHMLDAFMDQDEFVSFGGGSYRGQGRSQSDPLYYHHKIKFEEIVSETDKAYLFRVEGLGDVWVPGKICRHLSMSELSVYVHSSTYNSICRKNRRHDIGDDFNE